MAEVYIGLVLALALIALLVAAAVGLEIGYQKRMGVRR